MLLEEMRSGAQVSNALAQARFGRLVALGVAAAALVYGLDLAVGHFEAPKIPAFIDRNPTSGAARNYPDALRRIDESLAGSRERARTRGGEWLIQEKLAYDLIVRARLTGSFDDYAEAQQALDRGFATAPAVGGPNLTQAVLAFGMHQLGKSEAALAEIGRYAVAPEAESVEEIAAMSGDIAFYRGDYAGALRRYHAAAAGDGSGFRLTVYKSKTGQADAALAAITASERHALLPTAHYLANLALQRGTIELQRGNWDIAATEFARADRLFPGSWLIEAHVAQMLALLGKRAEAINRLTAIATRSGAPDVMDLLAGLYRAQGDFPRSKLWADQAGAIWKKRLGQFPEAAYGHAVEHELAFGDAKLALDLARRDYAARPYAVSSIGLAWALVANNRAAEALAALAPVLASPWVSAEQHVVAAQAHVMLGQSDAADAEQQKALTINPRALDRDAALIWFGH